MGKKVDILVEKERFNKQLLKRNFEIPIVKGAKMSLDGPDDGFCETAFARCTKNSKAYTEASEGLVG